MQINDRIKRILTIGALVLGLITSGCGSQQAAPKSAIPEVAVVTVQPERVVLTTELPGRTSAYFVAEIRPQVNGIIQKRLFDEGSDVRAGEVLYQIDPAPFQAAYDNAAANVAVTRKGTARAQATLQATIAGVTRQRATLDLARTNRWRFEELFKSGAVSTSQRDQAVTEAEVARPRQSPRRVKSDEKRWPRPGAVAGGSGATTRINLGYTGLQLRLVTVGKSISQSVP
jgi:membrane fusion protein (multidrug efflux system)